MTEDEQTILMIKGCISELSPEKQAKCREFSELILTASVGHEDCMILVIALIGAKMQVES